MKLTTLVIAAALAAGCSVHGDERSFMVGTKVVPATPSTAANATGCVYDATTPENVFGAFDPAFGYVHAVVVENRMVDNASLGPGRIGTNDFQVEGATATMGSDDYIEGPWGQLATHVRKLLGELVSMPQAAVGLEVGEDGRSARLVHLGDKPLAVDLSKLSIRAVLWGRGFRKLGDWSTPAKPGPVQAEASDSWNAPLPFDHGLKPGKNKVLHVYVTFAVSENGQRADVRVEHTPAVPA